MGARTEFANGIPDPAKWAAAAAVLAAGLAGFYFFADHSQLLRVVGLLIAAGAAIAIAVQTDRGRVAWEFVREARTELRKVVWPNRRETLQTTGIVIAMVTLVAIMLWIVDGILAWLVRTLLGTGG